MKQVGIFSGTFDPVHKGHISFAREAINKCNLDKVFILVEPRPRRKQAVKAFAHRVNMVRLAIEDEPRLGLIILEQARFTVPETLPILSQRFKGAKINLLMGEDVVKNLAHWPLAGNAVDEISFIIGARGSNENSTQQIDTVQTTSGRALNHTLFTAELSQVNSSEIRRKLRQGDQPDGLHPEVLTYIVLNGLYAPASN